MVSEASAIQYVTPKTRLHSFTGPILDKTVIFQVVKLEDSVMIYVNETDRPRCDNVDMAMVSRFSSEPHATTLMGGGAEHAGNSLALRLAGKLKKTVFFSLNVTDSQRFVVPLIEKRLNQEIGQFPDKF